MATSDDMDKVTLAMNEASIQVVEEESEVKKKKIDRHCGFCLTLVPGAEVKLCGKCKRRAYCSKECQVADWKLSKDGPAFNGKIHGYGQGHKNWCGLPYGEEDLDWKVTPISGKGLGIVALRDLPPLYRVIVEGMQHMPVLLDGGGYAPYHPGLDDLVPSLPQSGIPVGVISKFCMNAQGASFNFFGAKVGLRCARTNHNCDANASCSDDEDFQSMISFSDREIKEGEEICFAYVRFNKDVCKRTEGDAAWDLLSKEELRAMLCVKWGVICPPSCACKDLEKLKMLETCKKLDEEAQLEASSEPKKALKKMEKIIEIAGKGKLGCSANTMGMVYFLAFEYAMGREATYEKGKEYYEMFLKFHKVLYHPNSMKFEMLVQSYSKMFKQLPRFLAEEGGRKGGK